MQTTRSLLRRHAALLAAMITTLVTATRAEAQYTWRTLAGNQGGRGYSDGTGPQAHFNSPGGIAADGMGNLYVADSQNHTIRKVTPGGVATTFAGSPGSPGSTDGTGSAARFNFPTGIAVDSGGNVYVGDFSNHTIRKITPAGVVTTFVGSAGQSGYLNATGIAARFNNPRGVALDSGGNLYVADSGNTVIRKISPAGAVTTLAGTPGTGGDTDGTGTAAKLLPSGVTVDLNGIVYVASGLRNTIRKITPQGVVTTLAGYPGANGSHDGTGNAALFYDPLSLVVDATGTYVYVADTQDNTIRKITTTQGAVTTIAGSGYFNVINSFGSNDGPGNNAQFSGPQGITIDGNGDLWVADSGNNAVRKVTTAGFVTTIAGSAAIIGSSNGTGTAASFGGSRGVALDAEGNTYVADTLNHTIRKITPAGVVSTVAGSAGNHGSTDAQGTAALFYRPGGIAVESDGTLVVADTFNHTIRLVTPGGMVSTLAGFAGSPGSTDATGSAARFNYPAGVSLDSGGNIYVADQTNFTIRKVTLAGVVTTLAGSPGSYGSTDSFGSSALFNQPSALAVDSSGNIYVADTGNNTIRKVTSMGWVTTLAGSASQSSGSADGTGTNARFNSPAGIAVDGNGMVYVSDTVNQCLRQITPGGVVTTIGGHAGEYLISDGLGIAARFNYPAGIAVNALATQVVVSDTQNYRIVTGADVTTQPPVLTTPASHSAWGQGIDVSYTLPETALPDSVTLTFAGTLGTTVLHLIPNNQTLGQHNFSLNLSDLTYTQETSSIEGPTSLADDVYTVTLSYQDASGNPAATAVSSHVVVDTMAPEVTPPPDQSASATSLAGATVTFPEATALADDGGPISMYYYPSNNTLFPLGTTVVHVTGFDAAGNAGYATFKVTVRLNSSLTDIVLPTVAIRTPVVNASVPENSSLQLAGSASDNKRVLSVQVRLNNGAWMDVPISVASTGKTASYSLSLLSLGPVAGVNVIGVRSMDLWGNTSAALNRTFTYVVLRALYMPVDPTQGKVTISPNTALSRLQVGATYTLTATPTATYLWDYWSAYPIGVLHATANRFSFVMQEGLAIYPSFVFNPFIALAGNYNGLVTPVSPTLPSVGNNGMNHLTLTSTGAYTGKLTLNGLLTSYAGIFDPHTGASTVGNSTTPYFFQLALDLTGGTGQITGPIARQSQGHTVDTYSSSADFAYYNNVRKVTPALLTPAGKAGTLTFALPAHTTQSTLSGISQYPQGTGFGTFSVQATGSATLTGTLADGEAFSAVMPLSKTLAWPLYAVLANHMGVVTGMVQFDPQPSDSDVTATNLNWFRPATPALHTYPAGWPAGIQFDLMGAKFTAPSTGAVIPTLLAPDAMLGNATLTFMDGKLTGDIVKKVNISAASKVTSVLAGDTSFTLTLAPATGAITGSFTHSDLTKPALKGIVLQKGGHRGGYGYFLSTLQAGPGATSESGSFELLPR